MKAIKSIKFVNGLGNSPAAINTKTGVCYINLDRLRDFTPDAWEWILEHENAHAEFQTGSEVFVDRIAFNKQLRKGKSMKEIFMEIRKFLDLDNPEHNRRLFRLIQHASYISKAIGDFNLNYNLINNRISAVELLINNLEDQFQDAIKAGNGSQALAIAKKMQDLADDPDDFQEIKDLVQSLEVLKSTDNIQSGNGKGLFGGIIKNFIAKAQERKDKRLDAKIASKASKNYARETRADATKIKANAKQTLADQGLSSPNVGQTIAGVYGKVLDTVGGVAGAVVPGLLGIPANQPEDQGNANARGFQNAVETTTDGSKDVPKEEKKKPNTWLIVGAVVAGVLVVAGIGYAIYHSMKKKA